MLLWLDEKLLFMDIKKKRMNIPMQKKPYSVVYKKFKKIKVLRDHIFSIKHLLFLLFVVMSVLLTVKHVKKKKLLRH